MGTPRVGVATSEYGRDYRVGYGLGVLGGEGTKFELGVDAQRRESLLLGGTSNGSSPGLAGLVDVGHDGVSALRASDVLPGKTSNGSDRTSGAAGGGVTPRAPPGSVDPPKADGRSHYPLTRRSGDGGGVVSNGGFPVTEASEPASPLDRQHWHAACPSLVFGIWFWNQVCWPGCWPRESQNAYA